MAFSALESTDDDKRGSLSLSQEQGDAELTFRLFGAADKEPPTVDQVNEFINYFLGGVQSITPEVTAIGDGFPNGRILRVLPPVHNFRPELSAAAIKSLVGIGTVTAEDSVEILGLPETSFQFPHCEQYEAKVTYSKRPYFLLADDDVATPTRLYYPPDGSAPRTFTCAEEWTRFTQITRQPLNDTANATQGMMTFQTASGLDPNNFQYGLVNYVYLSNQAVEITWYQVPFRYVLDFTFGGVSYPSYLNRFVNRINQTDWYGFPAGTLLYLGATPTAYIPSNPKASAQESALASGLSQNLLCNLKLKFLYTSREGTDVPDYKTAPLFTNRSFIPAGWNLLPNFANRRFYYTTSPHVDPAQRRPSLDSAPFELLFTDPLLEQIGGPL